jgi:hypothetical protein
MQSCDFLELLERHLDCDVWPTSPAENDPAYFRAWQLVAVALQRGMRRWAAELYFLDLKRFEDREEAYPMVVYSACRLCYGRPRTEFTYDIADAATLPAAMRSIGIRVERALEVHQARLKAQGRDRLARWYSPIWYEDVLAAAKKHPKRLVALIAREARLIDAVIDLGTSRDEAAAHRSARTFNFALRKFHDVDMRELLPRVLQEATIVLHKAVCRIENSVDRRMFEGDHMVATGGPDARVGGEEDGDGGDADGCGEVRDAGVVADVHASG